MGHLPVYFKGYWTPLPLGTKGISTSASATFSGHDFYSLLLNYLTYLRQRHIIMLNMTASAASIPTISPIRSPLSIPLSEKSQRTISHEVSYFENLLQY